MPVFSHLHCAIEDSHNGENSIFYKSSKPNNMTLSTFNATAVTYSASEFNIHYTLQNIQYNTN